MNRQLRHKVLIGISIFLLALGLLNYLFFQPDILLLHYFNIKTHSIFKESSFEQLFFAGYFSDIMWCSALCLVIVVLDEIKSLHTIGKGLLLALPFITEIAQGFHLIRGTFDWYDIACYATVIFLFSLIFPSLIFIHMKKFKSIVWPVSAIIVFFAMAVASTPPRHYTYHKPQPEPCVKHDPLNYSPVLVKINLSGSYTMKDLSGAQRASYEILMDDLKAKNPYKYQLADGVTPNLSLTITVNTDSYQHYGATIYGTVYDGSFNNTIPTNYVTPEKLLDDVAGMVDGYIRYGWQHGNCK